MADKAFKVKNNLIVGDSATIGNQLTVDGKSVFTGDATFSGAVNISGSITGGYAGFDSDFTAKSTADLSEGSNLYYTTARVDSAIDFKVDSAFVELHFPTAATLSGTQTLTNKTLVDPTLDSTSLFGQPYGGLSVNANVNKGDSDQSILSFISDDSSRAAGIALGVNNQVTHVIATTGTAASNDLVFGLEGTNSEIKVYRNTGSGRFNLNNPAVSDDLVTITNEGNIKTNSAQEATNQSTGSIVTKGGIAAEKNIRGEDIIAANNIQANGGQLLGTLSAASLSARSTDDLSEGSTNRYFTDARVDSYINASILTTDVSEGTNLYYLSSRADSDAKNAIDVSDTGGDGSLTYDASTGVITYLGPSAAEVRTHFAGGTGVTYTQGTGTFAIGQAVATTDSVDFAGMTINGNLNVTGDFVVGGGYFLDSQQDLRVRNALIKLADSNTADIVDIGVVGRYSQDGGSTIRRAGFFRDASNGEWYTFNNLIQDNLDSAPAAQTINRNGPGFELGTWNFGKLRGQYTGFDSDFAKFSSNYTVYESDFTAVNAGRYAINTSAGQVTVTLPSNPSTGDYVRLIDVNNFTTNSVIVERNGETIEGFAENFELDLGQSIIEFIHINNNWQLYTSIGQRGPKGDKGDSADTGSFASQAQSIAFSVALG